jgi:hypothetical protein
MRNPACSWRKPGLFLLTVILLAAACGSSASKPSRDGGPPPGDVAAPPPGDTGAPPDAKAVPPVSQFAKLCGERKRDLATAMCPAGGDECAAGCTYFLSASQGSDSADGRSASSPWQSLAKLAKLQYQPGDTVCLRRGDTFRGSVQLPYGVHAPAANPVVIRPYGPPGADRPVISGARVIATTWTVSSLSPEILQVSLAGVLGRGPTYQSKSKSYTQRERIYQLFAAGQPQRLATFPNPGEGPSVAKGLDLPGGHYSLIEAAPSSTQLKDGRLPASNPLTGAAVNWTGARLFYRQIRWMLVSTDVTAFDASSRTLTVSDAMDCATDKCVGWGYFLVDNLGALDAPGEWYYDDNAQILYFYPPAGLDPASTLMEASVYTADAQPPSGGSPYVAPTLGLDLQGNSGFRIYGVTFQHFSGAGLRANADISSGSADKPESTTELRLEG